MVLSDSGDEDNDSPENAGRGPRQMEANDSDDDSSEPEERLGSPEVIDAPFNDGPHANHEDLVGFLMAMQRDPTDDEDSDPDNPRPPREPEEVFDINLPATHSYMGSLEEREGARLEVYHGWVGRVAGVARRSVALPGEVVPLALPAGGASAAIVRTALQKGNIIALFYPGKPLAGFPDDGDDERMLSIADMGSLCEVFEVGEGPGRGDDNTGLRCLAVSTMKARVLMRCKVHDTYEPYFSYSGVRLVRVTAIADLQFQPPLWHARLQSLDNIRPNVLANNNMQLDRRLGRLEAAVTPWPYWVHRSHDQHLAVEPACDFFLQHNLGELIPKCPILRSYWLLSNLPLSVKQQMAALRLNHTAARLNMAAEQLRKLEGEPLCCAKCGSAICSRQQMVRMTRNGLRDNYVNPGGYIHDVITVSGILRENTSGEPQTQFSWFPGYSWTLLLCAHCDEHIGWRFDALRSSLRPSMFYALSRANAVPQHVAPSGEATPPAPTADTHPSVQQLRRLLGVPRR